LLFRNTNITCLFLSRFQRTPPFLFLYGFELLTCYVIGVQAQFVVPDTLHDLAWERMDGPPGIIGTFAKSGNRLFGLAGNSLYYSNDDGGHWTVTPAKGNYLAATPAAVFVSQYMLVSTSPPYSGNARYDVYRSTDNGATFSLNFSVNAGWFHYGSFSYAPVVDKNEQTFCYLSYSLTAGGYYGNLLYHTNDAGETWLHDTLLVGGSLFAANDTVLRYNRAYANPPLNGVFHADLFGRDDFTDPVLDTLVMPANFSGAEHLFYLNGKYYAFNANATYLAVSTDHGKNWVADSTGLPAYQAQIQVTESGIYVAKTEGVFYAALNSPWGFDKIYTSTLSNGNLYAGLAGSTLYASEPGGFFRSPNSGQTWKRWLPRACHPAPERWCWLTNAFGYTPRTI
jgi:photosystem II stability/assembly factor-like uncharacterized protein